MRYAVREYACTAIDVIGRRTRLAFCNVHAAEEALPRVIEIMAEELKWNKKKQQVKCLFVWYLLLWNRLFFCGRLSVWFSLKEAVLIPIY